MVQTSADSSLSTVAPAAAARGGWGLRFSLAECVYQLLCESQVPNKIVNLLFTITNQNIKLTVWWWGRHSKIS